MSDPPVLPIRLKPSHLRPIAYRILSKKHGLNIQTEALERLTESIGHKFGSDWKGPKAQMFLEEVARIWKSQDRGLFIDGEGVQQVIREAAKDSGPKAAKLASSGTLASRSDTMTDIASNEDSGVSEYGDLAWADFFRPINAFEQPRYKYNRSRKKFDLQPVSGKLLSAITGSVATTSFLDRYSLLFERISRNENFRKPTFTSLSSLTASHGKSVPTAVHEITLIKNLLGRDGKRFLLFGVLGTSPAGDWTLQDVSDNIVLDISQALPTEGSYYVPGMFLLCDGIYSSNGRFYVSNMGHPPAERRLLSLETYGFVDFMGINSGGNGTQISKLDTQLRGQLELLEKTNNHRIVFLGGDCFLNQLRVFDGLKKLFTRLEDEPPLMVVISGSFSSTPFHASNASSTTMTNSAQYKTQFDNLAKLLESFPTLCNESEFVFSPGDNDPWQTTQSAGSAVAWPQAGISKVFTNRLDRVLKKVQWLSNPFRLNYLSQEIVVSRDDVNHRLVRNSVLFPAELEEEMKKQSLEQVSDLNIDLLPTAELSQSRRLVKTLLDQANLQPFLPSVKLINSQYDHVMRLDPLPSCLVLNDCSLARFDVVYNGCKVMNPGKLVTGKRLNYVEYFPSTRRSEFKEVYF